MGDTTVNNSLKIFENRTIRTEWNDEKEEWYFCVTDVVAVLTGSSDPKQYIKKMRSRDGELNARWGKICTLTATDGKHETRRYRSDNVSFVHIFNTFIYSITSIHPFGASIRPIWIPVRVS